MFAQADLGAVPADHFKWTIVIIIGLILVGLQIWTATRQNKTVIAPDPLRVEKFDAYATRHFCEMQHAEVTRRLNGHDADVRALYDEIKRDRQQNQEHASKRSETLYRKIEEVRTELSDKIDTTPSRVIETLSTLGLLRKPGEDE